MARRAIIQQPRLLDIIVLAGAASSTILTLSGFEIIASLTVPLSCIFAYNTPIDGCSIGDFTNEKHCSARCQQGLKRVQSNIQASCFDVKPAPGSLLFLAQQGKLLESICDDKAQPSDHNPPAQSAPAATPTNESPPPETSKPSPTEITTTVQATKTKTTSVRLPPTKTEKPSGTERKTTAQSKTASVPKSRPSQTLSTITSRPAAIPTQAEPQQTTSSTAAHSKAPKQTLLPGSGGGSPFDFVASGISWRPQLSTILCASTIALLLLSLQ